MKRLSRLNLLLILLIITLMLCPLTADAGSNINSLLLNNQYMRKDTPADFNRFLSGCSTSHKELLLRSLGEDTSSDPSKFDSLIRKSLVAKAYNLFSYPFRRDDQIEYHQIVQWAASKNGVDADTVEKASTYTLEETITNKHFSSVWDNMTIDQRMLVLENMEKSGLSVTDKAGIATMAGGWLLMTYQPQIIIIYSALSSVLAMSSLSSFLPIVIGPTLGLTNPIGWTLIAAGGVMAAMPDADKVSGFIMTVHVLRMR